MKSLANMAGLVAAALCFDTAVHFSLFGVPSGKDELVFLMIMLGFCFVPSVFLQILNALRGFVRNKPLIGLRVIAAISYLGMLRMVRDFWPRGNYPASQELLIKGITAAILISMIVGLYGWIKAVPEKRLGGSSVSR